MSVKMYIAYGDGEYRFGRSKTATLKGAQIKHKEIVSEDLYHAFCAASTFEEYISGISYILHCVLENKDVSWANERVSLYISQKGANLRYHSNHDYVMEWVPERYCKDEISMNLLNAFTQASDIKEYQEAVAYILYIVLDCRGINQN